MQQIIWEGLDISELSPAQMGKINFHYKTTA
jgi:hypothetical protein